MNHQRTAIFFTILIVLGFTQFRTLFYSLYFLEKGGINYFIISTSITAAPFIPFFTVLFLIFFPWRMHRYLAVALAIGTGSAGMLFSLFAASLSGGGAYMVLVHGFTLSLAVSASILFTARRSTQPSSKGGWLLLIIAAATGLWSLVAGVAAAAQAQYIAGHQAFCIAAHTENDDAPLRSFAELRGLSFYTTLSGYKKYHHWYFHGLLIVNHSDGVKVYNWSPRRLRFDLVENPELILKSPKSACVPRNNFWRSLSIL